MEENPPILQKSFAKIQTESANFYPYFFLTMKACLMVLDTYAEHLGHTVFVDNVYDFIHTFIDYSNAVILNPSFSLALSRFLLTITTL